MDEIKLLHDTNAGFRQKERLRRAPDMDFECSEQELNCIIAAEENRATEAPTVAEYRKLRLTPSNDILMPNKRRLKKQSHKSLVVWLSAATAAAATLALLLVLPEARQTQNDVVLLVQDSLVRHDKLFDTGKVQAKLVETADLAKDTRIVAVKRKRATVATVENRRHDVSENERSVPALLSANADSTPVVQRDFVKLEPIVAKLAKVERENPLTVIFVFENVEAQSSKNMFAGLLSPLPLKEAFADVGEYVLNSGAASRVRTIANRVKSIRRR
jgi:hypothetical protein